MQIEQVKPNKPSFGMVVALSGVALIVIFIAAVIFLKWRDSKRKNPTPFTKHPVSLIYTAPSSTRQV